MTNATVWRNRSKNSIFFGHIFKAANPLIVQGVHLIIKASFSRNSSNHHDVTSSFSFSIFPRSKERIALFQQQKQMKSELIKDLQIFTILSSVRINNEKTSKYHLSSLAYLFFSLSIVSSLLFRY